MSSARGRASRRKDVILSAQSILASDFTTNMIRCGASNPMIAYPCSMRIHEVSRNENNIMTEAEKMMWLNTREQLLSSFERIRAYACSSENFAHKKFDFSKGMNCLSKRMICHFLQDFLFALFIKKLTCHNYCYKL